jgi:hypothetical protein
MLTILISGTIISGIITAIMFAFARKAGKCVVCRHLHNNLREVYVGNGIWQRTCMYCDTDAPLTKTRPSL